MSVHIDRIEDGYVVERLSVTHEDSNDDARLIANIASGETWGHLDQSTPNTPTLERVLGELTKDDAEALLDWVRNQEPDSEEESEASVARQEAFCLRLLLAFGA